MKPGYEHLQVIQLPQKNASGFQTAGVKIFKFFTNATWCSVLRRVSGGAAAGEVR
jgi:predicted phosphoadenosine phosphosulfate sulfurtransferase